jgi:transposase
VIAKDAADVLLKEGSFASTGKNFETMARGLVQAYGDVHVHIEATDMAEWVRFVLKPLVKRVVVSHPKDNAYIARSGRKNDKADARALARLLALGQFREVYYSDEPVRGEFKRLIQLFDELVRTAMKRKQAIRTALRRIGIFAGGKPSFSLEGRKDILAQVAESPMASATTAVAIERLYDLLDSAIKSRTQVFSLVRKAAKALPEIPLLLSAPGMGEKLAWRFSAYVQDPARFANKRKLWSYCGLAVEQPSSDGRLLGRQHLNRNAVRCLKSSSRTAVIAALRRTDDNAIKRLYRQALDRTHSETHARLNAQRKLLAMLRIMWIKGDPYRDELSTV